jgi:hypothetical protein
VGSYKEDLCSLPITVLNAGVFVDFLMVIVGNLERDLALPDLLYKV